MKIPCLAAAAFAALAAAPLFAQPAQAPAPPSTRAEMEQSVQQRFAMRDANHDGFLTADELGDRAPMMMAQLDADHDGKISLGGELGRWRAACRPPAIHFRPRSSRFDFA